MTERRNIVGCFGPLVQTETTAVKFGTEIHAPLRTNGNNLGETLTFHLVPLLVQYFAKYMQIGTQREFPSALAVHHVYC